MKIWRICRTKFAGEAFSGEGARRYGGRWNSPGVAMVYSSSSLALAAIELFVHLEPNQQPDDLVAIAAELPGKEPLERVELGQLPRGWWKNDYAALRAMGDKWIREKRSLAMEVPSAALRAEWNVLVNPLHPGAKELQIEKPEPFRFDARMFR
jgi:RES domain-containing protein